MLNYNFHICIFNDLSEICKLEEYFGHEKYSLNSLKHIFEDDNCYIYVIKNEYALLGYIIIKKIDIEAEIYKIFVKEEYRKNNFATYLLNETIKILKTDNINKIFIEVRSKNIAAINFYKKNNFIEIGLRRKYYLDPIDDAILMSLDL